MSDRNTRRPPAIILHPNDHRDLIGATITGITTTEKGSTATLKLTDGTTGKMRVVSNEDALALRPPKKEPKEQNPRVCKFGPGCKKIEDEEHLKKFTHKQSE
jgi:hypothetical protein